MADITKTGPQTYKQLQKANDQIQFNNIAETARKLYESGDYVKPFPTIDKVRLGDLTYEGYAKSPFQQQAEAQGKADYWGRSMFDPESMPFAEWSSDSGIQNARSENQPWIAQLGAGITKGVLTAGTTFVNGVMGLFYGIGGIATGIDELTKGASVGEAATKAVSTFFDNSMSNAIMDINRRAEDWLPNYRTAEEEQDPWYKHWNMNLFADGFLKNIGFTVGAFASGKAILGTLKGLGVMKSGFAAQIAGSIFSAISEGGIEANNLVNDAFQLQSAQINDSYNRAVQEAIERHSDINGNIDDRVALNQELAQLETTKDNMLQTAHDNLDRAGIFDLISNIAILSLTNMFALGRLYSRGFNTASTLTARKGLSGWGRLRAGLSEADNLVGNEVAENVSKQAGKYVWNDITRGKSLINGLKIMGSEGSEEMMQEWAAQTGGEMYSPDSPDAYYQAMIDGKNEYETQDFLTSAAKGFMQSWGDPNQWEQFVIGALTGALGMPTFGRVNNADNNTYLGKGKMVGLSGGILGEFRHNADVNRRGREAVDVMNNIVDKIQDGKIHFTQSGFFTDAMNGYSAEKDKFEFESAKDNDLAVAFDAFMSTGREADFRALVNQDFENISDDKLEEIARMMDPEPTKDISNAGGQWRDLDGTFLYETDEGKAEMRRRLIENRDEILNQLDNYKQALLDVRSIGNNALSQNQEAELAWLKWKYGRMKERFDDIRKSNMGIIDTAIPEYQRNSDKLTEVINDIKSLYTEPKNKRATNLSEKKKQNLAKRAKGLGNISLPSESAVQNSEVIATTGETTSTESATQTVTTTETEANAVEKKAFEDINGTPTIEKCQKYLKDFPHGEHYEQVKSILEALEKRAKKSGKKETEAAKEEKPKSKYKERFTLMYNSNGLNVVQDKDGEWTVEDLENKRDEINLYIDLLQILQRGQIDDLSAMFTNPVTSVLYSKMFETMGSEDFYNQMGKNLGAFYDYTKFFNDILDTAKLAKAYGEFNDRYKQYVQDPLALLENRDKIAKKEAKKRQKKADKDFAKDIKKSSTSDIAKRLSGRSDEKIDYDKARKRLKGEELKKLNAAKDAVNTIEALRQEALKSSPANAENIDKLIDEIYDTINDGVPLDVTKAISQVEGARLSNPIIASEEASEVEKMRAKETVINVTKEQLQQAEEMLAEKKRQSQSMPTQKPSEDSQTPEDEGNGNADKVSGQNPGSNTITTGTVKSDDKAEGGNNERVSGDSPTPGTSIKEFNDDIDKSDKTNYSGTNPDVVSGRDVEPGSVQYWNGTCTTEYSFRGEDRKRHDNRSYGEIVGNAKYKAIHDFLKRVGAYSRMKNGEIKEGDKVTFGISKSLTKELNGIPVVLIIHNREVVDKETGEVTVIKSIIGDLVSPLIDNEVASNYNGLSAFTDEVIAQYRKSESTLEGDLFEFTRKEGDSRVPVESHVADIYAGKPHYTEKSKRLSLNTIHTNDNGENIPFKLGICVKSGDESPHVVLNSKRETNGVYQPDTMKPGQPFLLMPTSDTSKGHICVPVLMPTISRANRNSLLFAILRDRVSNIETVFDEEDGELNEDAVLEWKKSMEEVVALNGINVAVRTNSETGAKYFSVSIKGNKENDKWTEIYTCDPYNIDGEKLFEKLLSYDSMSTNESESEEYRGISIPFQVSLEHINKSEFVGIDGVRLDYNRLIGELMTTNLSQGSTHTILDFFTINLVDSKGNETKAKKIPSKERSKPQSQTQTVSSSSTNDGMFGKEYNGEWVYMEKKSPYRVVDEEGDEVDMPLEDKAYMYCEMMGYDLSDSSAEYKLPSSISNLKFNPSKKEFIHPKSDINEMLETQKDFISSESRKLTDGVRRVLTDKNEDVVITKIAGIGNVGLYSYEVSFDTDGNINITINYTNKINDEGFYVMESKTVNIEDLSPNIRDLVQKDIDDCNKEYKQQQQQKEESMKGNFSDVYVESLNPQNEVNKVLPISKDVFIQSIVRNSIGKIVVDLLGKNSGSDVYDQVLMPAFKLIANQIGNLDSVKQIGTTRIFVDDNVYREKETVLMEYTIFFEDGTTKSSSMEVPSRYFGSVINEGINKYMEEDYKRKNNIVAIGSSSNEVLPKGDRTVDDMVKNLIRMNKKFSKILDAYRKQEGETKYIKLVKDLSNDKELVNTIILAVNPNKLTNKQIVDKVIDACSGHISKEDVGDTPFGFSIANEDELDEESQAIGNDVWDKEKEIKTVSKMLPQLTREGRIAIVDGLLRVYKEGGVYAYGAFRNGVITIANNAKTGTLYHEAFHYVFNILFNDEERERLYRHAREKFGDLGPNALEEALADDFQAYMVRETDSKVDGRLKRFWKRLKNIITSLFNNQSALDSIYSNIAQGNYAGREERDYRVNNMVMAMDFINKVAPKNEKGELLTEEGDVSNLSPMRYALVRTAEFNSWSNGSILVDENDEPIVLYASPERGMGSFTTKPSTTADLAFFVKGDSSFDENTGIVTMNGAFQVKSADNISAYATQTSTRRRSAILSATDINSMTDVDVRRYHEWKMNYDQLSEKQRDYLEHGNLSKEEWNALPVEARELALYCAA